MTLTIIACCVCVALPLSRIPVHAQGTTVIIPCPVTILICFALKITLAVTKARFSIGSGASICGRRNNVDIKECFYQIILTLVQTYTPELSLECVMTGNVIRAIKKVQLRFTLMFKPCLFILQITKGLEEKQVQYRKGKMNQNQKIIYSGSIT